MKTVFLIITVSAVLLHYISNYQAPYLTSLSTIVDIMSYKPTVAIYGTSGVLGKPTLEAFASSTFSSSFQFPIKALTRTTEGKTDTNKIKYVQVDGDDVDSLVAVFKTVDVVISLVGGKANWNVLLKAISIAKPKLYIPSQFGTELDKSPVDILGFKTKHSAAARDSGVKTVDVVTSLFASPGSFMYKIIPALTLNKEKKIAVLRGDPKHKFAFTTLTDIGLSVAAIASKPPASLPNKIRIYSDVISQDELLAYVEKTEGVVYKKENVSAEASLKEAHEKLSKGFSFADFGFYLQTILSQGENKGLCYIKENERELVNPSQSVFKWGKF